MLLNLYKNYWDENLKGKPKLVQVDSLKNFNISTKGISVDARYTTRTQNCTQQISQIMDRFKNIFQERSSERSH